MMPHAKRVKTIGFLIDTQQTTCKYFGEVHYINRLRLIIQKPKQWGKLRRNNKGISGGGGGGGGSPVNLRGSKMLNDAAM